MSFRRVFANPTMLGRFVNRPYEVGVSPLICSNFAGAQCVSLRVAHHRWDCAKFDRARGAEVVAPYELCTTVWFFIFLSSTNIPSRLCFQNSEQTYRLRSPDNTQENEIVCSLISDRFPTVRDISRFSL